METIFTVLLVDDEPYVTEILGRILTQAKINTLSASSGDEALRLLRDHQVDLVITDVLMPGMNGLELLDSIKSKFPSLPVVVLTAHGDFYVAMEALNRGAFYFLTKPFNKETIIKVTEKALRLPRMTSEKKCVLPYASLSLHYRIPSELRMVPAISYQIMRACEDMEYPPPKVNFAIPLAVDELVVNAMKHGNLFEASKIVEVNADINHREMKLTVEDEGQGFNAENIPAEFSEERLLDENGRGIMMIRYYANELKYEKNGSRAVCRISNELKKTT